MVEPMVFGNYEVLRALGSSDVGTRFAAVKSESGRNVLLETLDPEIRDREDLRSLILEDARAAHGIEHPNLVAILDVGEEGSVPYIVTEQVRGATLAELVAAAATRNVRLSPRFAAAVACEVALALDALHRGLGLEEGAIGVVHGCVNTENVWIRLDGVVKLAGAGRPRTGLRLAKDPRGSARHVAPERADGHTNDPRSDVFGVGIVLLELLTQESLGLDLEASIERVRNPGDWGTGDEDLDEIVGRLLNADPEQRYQSAQETAEVLQEYAAKAGSADAMFKRRILTSLLGKLEDRSAEIQPEPVAIRGFAGPGAVACPACGSANTNVDSCTECESSLDGAAEFDTPPKTSTPPRSRGTILGRHRELIAAQTVLSGVLRGEPRTSLCFSGPAASGKTRLLEEVETLAKKRGFETIHLPCSELRAEGLRFGRARLATAVRNAVEAAKRPALEPFLELAERGIDRHLGARPRARKPELRSQERELRAAWIHALATASQNRPICVLIDDFEQLDAQIRFVVERFMSDPERGRVAVIATTSAIPPGSFAETLELPALEDRGILEATRVGAGGDLPPSLFAGILRTASGLPGSAVLLGHWLRGSGAVDLRGDAAVAISSPRDIEWPKDGNKLVAARLGQLAREARAIAITGSMMSPSFSPKVVIGCVGEVTDPKRAVRECMKSGLIDRSAADEKKIGFDQPWIQKALRETVPEAKRPALATLTARAMLKAGEGVFTAARAFLRPKSESSDFANALETILSLPPEAMSAEILSALEPTDFGLGAEDDRIARLATTLLPFDAAATVKLLDAVTDPSAEVSWSTYDTLDLRISAYRTLGETDALEAEIMSKADMSLELEGESGSTAQFDAVLAAEAVGTPEAIAEAAAGVSLQNPPDADLALLLGRLLISAADLNRPKAWLEGVLYSSAASETKASAHLCMAELQLEQNKIDQALGELDKAEAAAQKVAASILLAWIQLARGRACLEAGRGDMARKALARASDAFLDLELSEEAQEALDLLRSAQKRPSANQRKS